MSCALHTDGCSQAHCRALQVTQQVPTAPLSSVHGRLLVWAAVLLLAAREEVANDRHGDGLGKAELATACPYVQSYRVCRAHEIASGT